MRQEEDEILISRRVKLPPESPWHKVFAVGLDPINVDYGKLLAAARRALLSPI